MTKLLIRKFCPNIKDTIVALPEPTNNIYVPYFPLNWEKNYHYQTEGIEEKDYLENIAQGYRDISKLTVKNKNA